MAEEYLFWLAFSAFRGIGPKRFALLRSYFGSAKKAWQAKEAEFLALGLGKKLVKELIDFRKGFHPHSYFLRLCEKKVTPLFLDSESYPENLKKIDNPPFVLYVRGRLKPQDNLSLAVVGSRLMTAYGRQVTEAFVKDLVKARLTIISGLARGIDTIAHQSTLRAGGRTIAVLACGLDRCYPPENEPLVEEIIKGKGAVVSEIPLGQPPARGNFPARNRIISGLSLGTLVVEGAQRSGSLITARLAGEQGREVLAVPGPVTSPLSAAPAALIKKGAKLVFKTEDILEELGLESRAKSQVRQRDLSCSPEEEMLLSLLREKERFLEELVKDSGLDTGQVVNIIALLEIKGKVENEQGIISIKE